MIINITATNSNNDTFVFDSLNRIVNGLDLSGLGADVNVTDKSSGGAEYQNTRLQTRNINLEVQLRKRNQSEDLNDLARDRALTVFNPELNPIRLNFSTSNGEEYYLDMYMTASPIMPTNKVNSNAAYQSMLLQAICPDPYIYQKFESNVEISNYESLFEFDLEIPEEGIEIESKSQNLFGIIDYTGNGPTGITIKFKALSNVSNPGLVNVNTGERIRLNFQLISGDVMTINTERDNRSISLLRNNVPTNRFSSYVISQSTFLEIQPGTNIFRPEADSGLDFLEVTIEYRIRKVGL
jgi:hypothetical protein